MNGSTWWSCRFRSPTDTRPNDTEITDRDEAGLKAQSVVRLKLFTLDNDLLVKRIGALAEEDRTSLRRVSSATVVD